MRENSGVSGGDILGDCPFAATSTGEHCKLHQRGLEQSPSRNRIWCILDVESDIQGEHLFGKPGNVREFDSCQRNVRDFTKSQGIVREKILSGKSCLKFVYCKLHICVHKGI